MVIISGVPIFRIFTVYPFVDYLLDMVRNAMSNAARYVHKNFLLYL